MKVVQRSHSRHRRRERGRNLRVTGVRPVLFAIHQIFVNLRVQGFFHLRFDSGELNDRFPVGHAVHLQSVPLQPSGDGLNVLIGRAKLRTEFVGREPLVVIG